MTHENFTATKEGGGTEKKKIYRNRRPLPKGKDEKQLEIPIPPERNEGIVIEIERDEYDDPRDRGRG